MAAIYCPHCGKELLLAGQKFCAYCAGDLRVLSAAEPEAQGRTESGSALGRPIPMPAWPVRNKPKVLASVVVVALVLAVAGLAVVVGLPFNARGTSEPSSGSNIPPAGSIWFGSSVDTTTFAVAEHSSLFHVGPGYGLQQIVLVAHLSRPVPAAQPLWTWALNGATPDPNNDWEITVGAAGSRSVCPGQYCVEVPSASTSTVDMYVLTVATGDLTTGPHTFCVEDAEGDVLASGTVSLEP